MPIYEFKCASCGHVFETVVWISEARLALECPSCKGTDLERLLSAFSRCGPDSSSASACAPAGRKFG